MAIYPFPEKIQVAARSMTGGNFGLWYNKFVPLSENFKAANDRGSDTEAVSYYFERYNQMKRAAVDLLRKKHADQDAYGKTFPESDYEVITIRASLKTPLITGIGESHPHEVSMVFDHNLGIPYIPASGVKGIVRFAHTLSIFLGDDGRIKEEYLDKDYFEESNTDIPDIFGGEKARGKEKELLRGKVVFLDAYPEKVPDLYIDIMNPHHGPYYSEGKAPADYHNPTPIKFLTVAKQTIYIFHAVAQKIDDIPQKVRNALQKALKEEGIGAKTAVGYGRFEVVREDGNVQNDKLKPYKLQERSPVEKWCDTIKGIKANDAGKIGSTIDNALKEIISEDDKRKFAQFVKTHMGKLFKGSKALEKLKRYLL